MNSYSLFQLVIVNGTGMFIWFISNGSGYSSSIWFIPNGSGNDLLIYAKDNQRK